MAHVFGYGSLAERAACSQVARLQGYRRVWNVAMDNTQNLSGYKYYRRRSDGTRPRVGVAFLNLEPCRGTVVNGVLLPVTDADLKALDQRERNYKRRDVSSQVTSGERVWAYIGTAAAQARFDVGPTVVCREYLEAVEAAFASLGPRELAQFHASTEAPSCPVIELDQIDLPPL